MSIIKLTCPGCGEEIQMMQSDIELDGRIECPECGTLLEITSVAPLEVEPVEIDSVLDDDEFEDDDNDI